MKPGGRCRMKPSRSPAAPISKIPRPPAWWALRGLEPPNRSPNISGRRYKYEDKCRKIQPLRPLSASDLKSSGKMMLGTGSDSRNCGVFGKAPINQQNPPLLLFPPLFRLERRFRTVRIVFREVSKTIRSRLETFSRPIRTRLETHPSPLRSRKIRVFWD